jgi:hypothetical protein
LVIFIFLQHPKEDREDIPLVVVIFVVVVVVLILVGFRVVVFMSFGVVVVYTRAGLVVEGVLHVIFKELLGTHFEFMKQLNIPEISSGQMLSSRVVPS